MLSIKDAHVYYGGVHALQGVSMDVPQGSIVSLLGANGAGKTTTLRAICGVVHLKEGKILFQEQDIGRLKTFQRARAGIAMVPEGRRAFVNLTVTENLRMGAYARKDEAGIREDMDKIFQLFPKMRDRRVQKAATLSGGEQQMLVVGRALMSRPKLLLLDEPSLGLAPTLVAELFDTIDRIHREGMTILLVEQNAQMALEVADYAYVLELGKIALEGPSKDLIRNDQVRKAYLGED